MSEAEGIYSCKPEEKISMAGMDEKELVRVCPRTYRDCLMEGTCVVAQGDKHIPINYSHRSKTSGKFLFKLFDVNRCPYGLGVQENMCLDPYYSVAADLAVYKPGDVIFVPSLVGLDMGNGRRHHGFFIVRDMGHRIKGRGRFDFFTGYHSDVSAKNLFRKLQLGDKNTRLKYYLLKNNSTLNLFVKKLRNFPAIPSSK
jgi:3D (Asp-Asp-Asp) domain-containing protein